MNAVHELVITVDEYVIDYSTYTLLYATQNLLIGYLDFKISQDIEGWSIDLFSIPGVQVNIVTGSLMFNLVRYSNGECGTGIIYNHNNQACITASSKLLANTEYRGQFVVPIFPYR